MNIIEWKRSVKSIRSYTHFDERTDINKSWNKISNPKFIISHGFYPFIHYTMEMKKYKGPIKGSNIKKREIFYSSHIDRCIFQYYGYLLNEEYNKFTIKYKINNCSVAYRNNSGKSNINFAKEAFDFIKENPSYIMVGDFTNFFDKLSHEYLKKKICEVLGVEKLTDDFYAVFKNITKFAYWELESLLKINGLICNKVLIDFFNNQKTALSIDEFHSNKHEIKKNNNLFGIPQGSAISSILSNIYMINFDREIENLVKKLNGKYIRYSDDFIIIIPNIETEKFLLNYAKIMKIVEDIPNLILKPEKTQFFYYSESNIYKFNIEDREINEKTRIDYLGFTFDGRKICLRDKTITKYYYRMYRKVKNISGIYKVSSTNLYRKYSIKGAHEGLGNFLTYTNRCEAIFGRNEEVNRIKKVHMRKIRNRIKKLAQ